MSKNIIRKDKRVSKKYNNNIEIYTSRNIH